MLLSLSVLIAGAANAGDYACPGEFADLNAAFAALSGAVGPNSLSIDRDDCLPLLASDVVNVDVDVTCNIGGGCTLPPLRVSGGGHLGLSGVTFSTTGEFELDEEDDNREVFPGYDAVYASLYIDSTDLVIHDSLFESPSGSFGGLVAIDSATTLENVSFVNPDGHAMKLLGDDLDAEHWLNEVHVLGAGDSAILSLDSDDGYGEGEVSGLTITNSDFTNDSAYYGADLEVFIAGDVTLADTSFTGTDTYGVGAPVEVFAAHVSLTNVTFAGTYGGAVSTAFTGGLTVRVEGLTITDAVASEYLAYFNAIGGSSYTGSHIALNAPFYVTGGDAEFSDNTFLVVAGAQSDSGIRLATSAGDFYNNFFCGSGAQRNEYGLISGGTDYLFEENVFNGLDLLGPLVGTVADGDQTVGSPLPASFLDNTLVEVSAANLIEGDVSSFTFVNNLVIDSTPGFEGADGAGWQGSVNADYNAWTFSDGSSYAAPDGWGTHDLVGAEPAFVTRYDPHTCPSLPALQGTSPMIDRGSPNRYSGDGSRSDIGAVDFGDEAAWGGETWGDTGGEVPDADRDGDGWADVEDCAPAKPGIHPGAEDVPDDGVDQDCDGVEASTSFTGGCGCQATESRAVIPMLLGFILLVSRKRRR